MKNGKLTDLLFLDVDAANNMPIPTQEVIYNHPLITK